jgi:S1-C subfamily serine protease
LEVEFEDLPIRVIPKTAARPQDQRMATSTLVSLSDELAELTASAARSVVQVVGAHRPASGVVHGPDTIVTTARALGREDGLQVRLPDGNSADASLVGWDPASGIALLRSATPLHLEPPPAAQAARTGELAIALGRSWSNAPTASSGIVAIVGGPLRTGRRRQLEHVIRITARLHDGFSGGGVFNAHGALLGIATAAQIRGYSVVVPASIAWAAAAKVLESGTPRRAYLGLAVQGVELPPSQRIEGRDRALLVVAVSPAGPAEAGGVNVGDVVVAVDGTPITSADDLLDRLSATRAGETMRLSTVRGGTPRELSLVVGSRPQS